MLGFQGQMEERRGAVLKLLSDNLDRFIPPQLTHLVEEPLRPLWFASTIRSNCEIRRDLGPVLCTIFFCLSHCELPRVGHVTSL